MKTFLSSLAGLLIVIIIAAVIVAFIGWSRVPDIVANNLAKKMKVYVGIGSMGLGWGEITVNKIEIGNPPGTQQSLAFKCKTMNVLAPFTQYLKQDVVIDEINLNDVYLDLEFDSASGTKGNWTRIMQNLQNTTLEDQKNTGKRGSSNRTILIKKLVLTNISVDVVYLKEGGSTKRLPTISRIELTNISSEGGLPMDQIMNSVLGQMLKSVFIKENLKNMMNDLLDNTDLLPSGMQKYIVPFKGIFGKHQEDWETSHSLNLL